MIGTILSGVNLLVACLLLIQQIRMQNEIILLANRLEEIAESEISSVKAEQDLNKRLTQLQTMRFSSMVNK
jgi:hypothetical protein